MAEANTNKQFVDTDQFFVMRFELSDLDIDPDLGALALAIIGFRSILNYVDYGATSGAGIMKNPKASTETFEFLPQPINQICR